MEQTTRRIKIIAAAIFALSIYCRYCLSEITEPASKEVNYVELYNKYASAGRDASANAANNYKKAFELFVKLPEDFNSSDLNLWPSMLPDKKLSAIKEWISANNAPLEEFKIGSQKDAYWTEVKDKHLFDNPLPNITKVRLLGLALTFRSKSSAINGDFTSSFSDLLAVFSIGNQFSSRKLLTEQLVGCALRTIAARTSFEILSDSAVSSADLKNLQGKFIALSQKTGKLDFFPERLFTRDCLNNLFTDDGKGDGFVSEKSIENENQKQKQLFRPEFTEEEKQKYRTVKQNETVRLTEKVYDYAEKNSGTTPYFLNQIKFEDKIIEMAKDNCVVSQFTSLMYLMIKVYHQAEMNTQALITTIAIIRYKTDKKDLPGSLDELITAGYLAKIPADVCSSVWIVYKKTGDDFVLYSVGGDFDDDKAEVRVKNVSDENGDIVFWPVEKSR